MTFDFGELTRLSADLGRVLEEAEPRLRQSLEVTSRHIKDAWKDKVAGARNLPGLAEALSYDVDTAQRNAFHAEIGFDKSRSQGPLGNISEFGTSVMPGRGYGQAALHENEADFEHGVNQALLDAERDRNL